MRLSEITYNPRLKELLLNLPKIDCDPSCGECCRWHDSTKTAVTLDHEKGIIIRADNKVDMDEPACAFLTDKGCEIYEDRGPLCRLFGLIEVLSCPKEKKPERYLSNSEVKEIVSLWCCEISKKTRPENA